MSAIFCSKCGYQLRQEASYCPRCGTPAEAVTPLGTTGKTIQQQPSQSAPVAYSQPQSSSGRVVKGVIIGLLIILVLIVPVIPRDRVVYVNGVTQSVTMSTAYNTSIQTYTTTTPMQVGVYQGTLQYIPNQYYSQSYNQNYNQYNYGGYQYPYYYGSYPYTNTSPSCYYSYYNNYYCSYSYYYYPYSGYYNYRYRYGYSNYAPYYGYNNYATTVTVNPSDDIVRVQQTQESNGLTTLTLFHFDGTSTTYNHVTQQNLAQSATSTIPMTGIVTNTITNSAVTPITSAVQCQNCILQHVTDYVSLLQLILGY